MCIQDLDLKINHRPDKSDFEDYAEELVASLSDAWQLAHESTSKAEGTV